MDSKRSSPNARAKRSNKQIEENYWDCSVCTYKNTAEAFKCLMCDTRKGTSTRKPRLNPQIVPQVLSNPAALPTKSRRDKESKEKSERKPDGNATSRNSKARPRLKNVDRSTAMHKEVTVNNVTVVITEFRPKISKSTSPSTLDLDHTTNSSSSSASHHGNDLSPPDQGHSD